MTAPGVVPGRKRTTTMTTAQRTTGSDCKLVTYSATMSEAAQDARRTVEANRLIHAFNAVANDENWKKPVRALVMTVPAAEAEAFAARVREAVTFFTGSVCSARAIPESGRDTYAVAVQAAGYYAAVGA